MTVLPTFTTGQVLTSTAANLMANSGLVFVKQQTVGNGVTSVAVTSAFSADYDNYRVIYAGGTAASPASITFALTGSATGYYSAVIGTAYAGGTNGIAESNSTLMSFAGIGTAQGNSLDLTLYNPFSTFRTGIQFTGRVDMRSNGVAFVGGGYHDVASSFTGFTMTCGAALTGGIIYVYGFRKA